VNAIRIGSRAKEQTALIASNVGQQRHFFKQFFQQQAAKRMRSALDGTTDEKKLLEYIRMLGVTAPREVLSTIEKGWDSGKLPFSEPILKEYFKAAAAMRKLDTVNITGLLSMLNKNGVSLGADAAGGVGNQAALAALLKSTQRFSAGSSPNDPLFVANPEPSWKSQVRIRPNCHNFELPQYN
jgi:hypothetical protein